MRVFIGQLDVASAAETESAHGITSACRIFDQPDLPTPSLDSFRAALGTPNPIMHVEHYLGYRGDDPVGFLTLRFPRTDNLSLGYLDLSVLPAQRRHGVGRELLRVAVERARDLDRQQLIATTVQARPDGAAFAEAVGAKPGRAGIRYQLTLPPPSPERLDALLAEAWTHAEGYRLVQWTGVPPEELLDDVAYLQNRLNTDSPAGNLHLEAETADGEVVRQQEIARQRRGRISYSSGILAGDRLVAWTVAAGRVEVPAHVDQLVTLVAPEHRGHRLGLIVKLSNLSYLRAERPGLTTIDTIVEPSNTYMTAINAEMGFEAAESLMQWQLTVAS